MSLLLAENDCNIDGAAQNYRGAVWMLLVIALAIITKTIELYLYF